MRAVQVDSITTAAASDWRGRLRWLVAFCGLFLVILIWRWEIIDSPPYWDSAMGLFLEADFLADTHFDYRRLIFEEKRFMEGGKGVYLNSILPSFVATLMLLCPTPTTVFIVYRLFNFACAAAILLLVYAIARRRAGPASAVLLMVVLATVPVFAVQIDMLGMDLPMVAVGLLATKFVFDGRYALGAVTTLAAYFVKSSAQALTMASAVYLLCLLVITWRDGNLVLRRRLWIGLGASFLALAIEIQLSSSIQSLPTSEHEAFTPDLWQGVKLLRSVWAWCPDIVLLFGVTLVAWLAIFFRDFRTSYAHPRDGARAQGANAIPPTSMVEAVRLTLWQHHESILAWIIVFGMLLAFALVYTIPRYLVLPLVFLILILGTVTLSKRDSRPYAMGLLLLLGVFNVLNLDGRFLPELSNNDPFDQRTGAILERSREYLVDHRANIALVKLLSENYRDWSIVAPNPFVHFLSLPRLGYVAEPLHGYSINTFTTPTFPHLLTLREDPFRYLLFVWAQNRFMAIAMASATVNGTSIRGIQIPFPEGREDLKLIFRDETFGPLLAYYRLWPAHLSPEDVRNTYLAELLGGEAFMDIAKRAAEAGELQAALVVYRQVQADDPTNVKAIALGASILYLMGETEKAPAEYKRALALDPENSLALNGLGALVAQRGDYNAAIEYFVKAAKSEAEEDAPDQILLGELYRNWALALARKGDLPGATEKLGQAIKANPEDSAAHRELGDIEAQLGNLEESRKQLEQAVNLNPKDSAAWLSLAVMAANAGNAEEAEEALGHVDTATPLHGFRGAMVLEHLGRAQEAESAYTDLLRRLPTNGETELRSLAHFRRGNLRLRRGAAAAGAEDFELALQFDPKLADAANNLAWLRATSPDPSIRDGQEAVRRAEHACSLLAEEQPGFLDTLAAAYARQQMWDQAVAAAERAESLARKQGTERLAEEIAKRRHKYERREAYEQPMEKNAP